MVLEGRGRGDVHLLLLREEGGRGRGRGRGGGATCSPCCSGLSNKARNEIQQLLLLLPLLQLQLQSAALPPLVQGFCAPLVATVHPTGSSIIPG